MWFLSESKVSILAKCLINMFQVDKWPALSSIVSFFFKIVPCNPSFQVINALQKAIKCPSLSCIVLLLGLNHFVSVMTIRSLFESVVSNTGFFKNYPKIDLYLVSILRLSLYFSELVPNKLLSRFYSNRMSDSMYIRVSFQCLLLCKYKN